MRSGSSSPTERPSKSGRRRPSPACLRAAALIGLVSLGLGSVGCALLPKPESHGEPKAERRHPLENPPPSPDLVGRLSFRRVRAEDTFVDLAPELGVGYVELSLANRHVDPWVPKAGERIVVPRAHLLPSAPRDGIIINTGDRRLYYFAQGERVRSYPIGIAKEGFATPEGTTKVVRKKENPIWYPTASARRDEPSLPAAVPPGPENRLGTHALYLGWPTYLIHGTNDPRGVGRFSSRGCIRLYPKHIEDLFQRVPVGTKVRVVYEPVKTGWIAGELYLEVHPDKDQALSFDETGKLEPESIPDLRELVLKAAGKQVERVDWQRVERVSELAAGIPVRITRLASR